MEELSIYFTSPVEEDNFKHSTGQKSFDELCARFGLENLSEYAKVETQDRDESHGYEHLKKVAVNAFLIIDDQIELACGIFSQLKREGCHVHSANLLAAKMQIIRHDEYDFRQKSHRIRLLQLCELMKFIEQSWDYESEDKREMIRKIAFAAGLTHDLIDRKYAEDERDLQEQKDNLEHALRGMFVDSHVTFIMSIIENVSFSVEKRDGYPHFLENLLPVRDAVSDADKIEAIGPIGIKRCAGYTIKQYKKIGQPLELDELKRKVAEHANEKLLRLARDYIHTQAGKQMALPMHKFMLNCCRKLEKDLRETVLSENFDL